MVWVFVSPTGILKKEFEPIFARVMSFNNLTSALVQRIRKRQSSLLRKLEDGEIPAGTNITLGVWIDDNAFEGKIFRDETVKWIILNGRHYHLFTIWGMQYLMDVPKNLRSNFHVIVATAEDEPAQLGSLYENAFGMFDTQHEFAKVFKKCTENNTVMVHDRLGTSKSIEDRYFWYRACHDRLPPFRMGHETIWKVQKSLYDHAKYCAYIDGGGYEADQAKSRAKKSA